MRRNFKNERTATAKTIGKKTACMVAMMTAMFALTACGDEETPEEKLKNELSSAIEDIGNSMNNADTSTEPETQLPSYMFENGVLIINVDTKNIANLLKEDNIATDDVVEILFAGNATKADGCSTFKNVKKVTFGESVVTICQEAFSNCNNLETIIMADNVTTIEKSAFWSCDSLVNVKLSANLESIGDNAFHDCISLTTMNIPASVKRISNQAFESCRALTTITLEEGLESISNAAFAGVAVTELNIPSTVTYIGEYAISSCPNLTSIVLPNGIEQISKGALAGCPSLTSVTIPDSVTFIYENPIGENEALTIYGKAGSLAEKFATDYGFKFIAQ